LTRTTTTGREMSEQQRQAAVLIRRRAAIHMLCLAALRDPGADREQMVGTAAEFGSRLAAPVGPAVLGDVLGMTVAELFDLAACGVPAGALRDITIGGASWLTGK
jgi:hypothetical protein